MEIRQLKVLQAVAREGSFRSAGDVLDLSQSAVSQHMARLEEAAGQPLVERSRGRRHVELTEAGLILLKHADTILARAKAAEADLAAFRSGAKGTLRVGTYQSIGARILPRLLPGFAAAWPDVEVRLVEGLADEKLLHMVESGELELTFTTFPTRPGPFEAVRLLDDPYVLAVPVDGPLARLRSPVALAALQGMRLLGITTCQADVTERLRILGVEPAISFPSADNAVVQGLVAAGVAAALAPLLTIDLTDERVAVLRLLDMPPRTLGLAWHAERYRSTALEAFRGAAVRLCGQLERQVASRM